LKKINNIIIIGNGFDLAHGLKTGYRDFIDDFNKEFSTLQNKLELYLTEQQNKQDIKILPEIMDKIQTIKKNHNKSNLFLNFNYTTKTERLYFDCFGTDPDCIHIHGELNNKNNPIIFGYGDELDDENTYIESQNDNRYLEFKKSIKYLETGNYQKFLNFIELDEYQVFIMGHSCGISDRTLLNTLFEHNNCKSIKIFYYKSGEWDNYRDLIENISRHFTDKSLMRKKVVKLYRTTK